eukprot:479519-Pelagomonas_calceolata.AAC.1
MEQLGPGVNSTTINSSHSQDSESVIFERTDTCCPKTMLSEASCMLVDFLRQLLLVVCHVLAPKLCALLHKVSQGCEMINKFIEVACWSHQGIFLFCHAWDAGTHTNICA